MEDRYIQKAEEIRALKEPHYNCAQGVLIPFAFYRHEDTDLAFRTAGCFGGGMRIGSTCGAITGSLMVLGMYGLNDPHTVNDFFRRFKERHDGLTNCRDLLSVSAAKGEVKKVHCDGLVYECIGIVEEILKEHHLLEEEHD